MENTIIDTAIHTVSSGSVDELKNVWKHFRFPRGWNDFVKQEFAFSYMDKLSGFLNLEWQGNVQIFPPRENIFRALQILDLDDVHVVVLGQDPYHGDGQANGLAFAVSSGIAAPPSLVNIFKEVEVDLGCGRPSHTTLEGWARQGVLLLNTVLTVRAHEAFSHRNKGWERFTEQVIIALNARNRPIVFMLWGAPAHKKARFITNPNHLVLQAPHPSPLSAYRGFLGCRHFSKANEFLQEKVGCTIDWIRS